MIHSSEEELSRFRSEIGLQETLVWLIRLLAAIQSILCEKDESILHEFDINVFASNYLVIIDDLEDFVLFS